jgi:hypothetical protein
MKQRLVLAGILTAIIVSSVCLYLFSPWSYSFYPPCPFNELTGLHCPGCGSLRATHHLLHGNLLDAFDSNPLMVFSLPFLGYSLLSYSMLTIRKRPLPGVFLRASWIWLILGGIIAFWILRNIPFYPFSWLAP